MQIRRSLALPKAVRVEPFSISTDFQLESDQDRLENKGDDNITRILYSFIENRIQVQTVQFEI